MSRANLAAVTFLVHQADRTTREVADIMGVVNDQRIAAWFKALEAEGLIERKGVRDTGQTRPKPVVFGWVRTRRADSAI
jgi:predicted ArsR family transcriptional regulator